MHGAAAAPRSRGAAADGAGVRRGVVWYGWCGVVWCGVVWCGVVWRGVAWRGVAWRGVGGVGWGGLGGHCFTLEGTCTLVRHTARRPRPRRHRRFLLPAPAPPACPQLLTHSLGTGLLPCLQLVGGTYQVQQGHAAALHATALRSMLGEIEAAAEAYVEQQMRRVPCSLLALLLAACRARCLPHTYSDIQQRRNAVLAACVGARPWQAPASQACACLPMNKAVDGSVKATFCWRLCRVHPREGQEAVSFVVGQVIRHRRYQYR